MSDVSSISRRNYALAAGVIAVALLAVYVPGLRNALIFDDARLTDGVILDNYGSLLKLQPRALSYGTFAWLQPLFDDSYVGQRIINLALHALTCVAMFFFITELLRSVPSGRADDAMQQARTDRVATLVAVGWFAVHPMAVYGVGYLVQRSMVMATLFSIVACYCVVRGLKGRAAPWFVGALVAYAAALLSKEQSVMVAGLAAPLYVFIARPSWKRIAALGVVIAAILGVVAYLLTLRYGSIIGAATFDDTSHAYLKQLDLLRPGVSGMVYPLSILNQAALFFYYGLLWVLPNPQWMSIDMRPPFPLSFSAMPQVLGAVLFAAVALGSCWIMFRRRDRTGLAALLVLLAVIMYGTEFVTSWVQDPMVLYRSYLWAFPLVGLVALGLAKLQPKVIVVMGLVVGVLLAVAAWERVQSLRDDYTAWNDAAAKIDLDAPSNAVGRWRPFLNRGAAHLRNDEPDKALADFDLAVRLGEPLGSAQQNRGVALQAMGRHAQALQALATAEAEGFTEPALYYHRAISLSRIGRFKDAVQSYTQALAKPQAEDVRRQTLLERAEIAIPAQDYAVAVQDFKQLLAEKPDNQRYSVGLGIALVGNKQTAEALSLFDRLLQERPMAPALYGRALAHSAQGDRAAALRDLDQAIELEPRNLSYRRARQQFFQASSAAGNGPTTATQPSQAAAR